MSGNIARIDSQIFIFDFNWNFGNFFLWNSIRQVSLWQLSCPNCDWLCIGQMRRRLVTRVKEHQKSIVYNKAIRVLLRAVLRKMVSPWTLHLTLTRFSSHFQKFGIGNIFTNIVSSQEDIINSQFTKGNQYRTLFNSDISFKTSQPTSSLFHPVLFNFVSTLWNWLFSSKEIKQTDDLYVVLVRFLFYISNSHSNGLAQPTKSVWLENVWVEPLPLHF